MELGELFLIEDTRMSPEARVLWAAERYRRRYGQDPSLCLVHPSLLPAAGGRIAGLRVEAKPALLPNYLWLGSVAPEGRPKPSAR